MQRFCVMVNSFGIWQTHRTDTDILATLTFSTTVLIEYFLIHDLQQLTYFLVRIHKANS